MKVLNFLYGLAKTSRKATPDDSDLRKGGNEASVGWVRLLIIIERLVTSFLYASFHDQSHTERTLLGIALFTRVHCSDDLQEKASPSQGLK